jgi:hypothetical protein
VILTVSGYKDPSTMQQVITFGDLRVIDLDTGAVTFSQAFPIGSRFSEVSWVAVSHDAAVAALQTQAGTKIVNLTSGRVMRTFDVLVPWSFSWDHARLAADGGPTRNSGEIVDISTGQLLWTDSVAGRVTQGAIAEPGRSDLMLFTTSGGLSDLVVVAAGGAFRTIATNVFTAQVGPCPTCGAA